LVLDFFRVKLLKPFKWLGFSLGFIFFTNIEYKKKKLIDIGLFGFSWIGNDFQGIWIGD
jgi:hypothetical protein